MHYSLLKQFVYSCRTKCCRLPWQGVFFPDVGVGVLLADGSEGGGRREHGGGAVFRHDAEEGPGVRGPHGLTL